jgi:hypothetical protein
MSPKYRIDRTASNQWIASKGSIGLKFWKGYYNFKPITLDGVELMCGDNYFDVMFQLAEHDIDGSGFSWFLRDQCFILQSKLGRTYDIDEVSVEFRQWVVYFTIGIKRFRIKTPIKHRLAGYMFSDIEELEYAQVELDEADRILDILKPQIEDKINATTRRD